MTEYPVESSNIATVAHNEGDLFVRFKNGRLYRYKAVPNEMFDALLQAESKGKYLNANIKGHYEYEPVG